MQTRSQTKLLTNTSSFTESNNQKYPITRSQLKINMPLIDFDEASGAWMKNKIKIGNGMYIYKKQPFDKKSELPNITTRSGKVLGNVFSK